MAKMPGYATLNYRGGYGNANIGYSHSDDIKQLYYGVSGRYWLIPMV